MSQIKFKKEIETLIKKRDLIPDEFWTFTDGRKYRVIWFMNRQRPSVQASYDFDMERFGLTRDGRIIWGFDSGCSCPSPWSQEDYGDDRYETREWKGFETSPETAFDADWQDECYNNLQDYLLLLKKNLKPSEVLKVVNAEIRRFLIKRVGYENIKADVGAKVINVDGTSELLEFADGDKYVKVKDSSTDREYLLYVPQFINSCRQGIAWTFGLQEGEYNPIVET